MGAPQPLTGIRVLDLTRVLAGPWVGQGLADFGAEVIKVEQPGKGDPSRGAPPFLKDRAGNDTRESALYLCGNRGKRSITVNLADPRGQALVLDLARLSDVLLENYKVGDLARYGLDYASVRSLNPRIVYCSVTGFGQSGPYRERAGLDPIAQAMGGLMSVTGEPDDQPGGGPMKVGVHIADLVTGLNGVIGVLLALRQRDMHDGTGQHVDISLLDSQVSVLSHLATNYLITGRAPPRHGTASVGGVPNRRYQCADMPIMICASTDDHFLRFCGIMEMPEVSRDPRFNTQRRRVAQRTELDQLIAARVGTWKAADLLAALEGAGIPSGPINDVAQVFADPQVRSRGMEIRLPHPLAGEVRLVANAVKLSGTPAAYNRPPPVMGADTEDVLKDLLGRSDEEVANLRGAGVI
jgi:crotonobetainyl-CoA:carnitine CoA-transferase CaiB-like acyl-CoA transferase